MLNANSLSIGNRLKNDLISEVGITEAQAAGIVGNLAHESAGFDILQEQDPLIAGSRGGFGYAQWTGPRRKQFESWAADNGLDPTSYEANKGFLVHELKNTPESKVLKNLKKANTSEEAAQVFSDEFLRPGIPHTENRIALAQNFDDGAGEDILIGGQGNDTMTAYERARAKLLAKQSTEKSDLIAPSETEEENWAGGKTKKPLSQRMKDAGETILRQGLQGATFGFADEITDRMGAGIASLVTGEPYDVLLPEARETTKQDLKRDWEERPVLSAGANIGGGILTGGGLVSAGKTVAPRAAGAVINAAKTAPKTAAIITGAGGGGLYAAGQAEGPVSERIDDFGVGAAWGGPLGFGGYQLSKGVGTVGNAAVEKYGPVVAPYINKAKEAVAPAIRTARGKIDDFADDLISPAAQKADDITPAQLAGIFDEEDLAKLEKGRTIPLTKGDKTQDVRIQRREQIAAESGSEPMIRARAQQQEAARKPFVSALGEDAATAQDLDLRLIEQQKAEEAANLLRKNYDSLKARENAAWTRARDTGEGVGLRATTVQDEFVKPIENVLKERDYRPGDIPQLDKHMDELRSIISESTGPDFNTATNLKKLEQWKTRLNNLNLNSETLSPKSAMAVKTNVAKQYDNFMTNVRDDAIVNGNTEAIQAFKEARKLSTERFGIEQSDKVIGKILDSRDLQGEQLVNVMMGTEKLLAKGDDGRVLITMLSKAGDKAPEMRDAMKRGIMAKTFRRGIQSNTADAANPEQAMISFSKMRNEVGNLMQKKEVFETLFDANEQQYMRQFYDDLKFLASKQKGAINNSSTGVWTAEFATGFGKLFNNPLIRSNPVTGIAGNMAETQAQRYAAQQITGKAEKGLAEFFEQQINSIDAPAAYYGALGANAVGPEGITDLLGVQFEGENQ